MTKKKNDDITKKDRRAIKTFGSRTNNEKRGLKMRKDNKRGPKPK